VAIASAAEPGAAGRRSSNLVAIASAAEPGAAGRRSSNLVAAQARWSRAQQVATR